jgi:ribosome-associated toxin RatA of RatAB toxin-antitoxin module
VPYPADLMYAVVSDVEKYPEFLPWVVALRVLSRREDGVTAEMAVGYGGLRERYTSDIKLDPAIHRIDVAQIKGPFKVLETIAHDQAAYADGPTSKPATKPTTTASTNPATSPSTNPS